MLAAVARRACFGPGPRRRRVSALRCTRVIGPAARWNEGRPHFLEATGATATGTGAEQRLEHERASERPVAQTRAVVVTNDGQKEGCHGLYKFIK